MSSKKRITLFFGIVVVLMLSLMAGTVVQAATLDLIISEYGEGSGFNKYVEIYNGTGNPVDLSTYSVWRVSNGGTWPEATINLTGTLNDGEILVVYNPGTTTTPVDPIIAAAGNLQLASGDLSHNGDDAIGLVNNGVLIDAVGEDGDDPGSGWAVAGVLNATANHVLVRKDTICTPTTDWTTSRGTNATDSEWIVLANEDWSNIGTHTANCTGGPVDAAPSVTSISPANGDVDVAVDADITITFSEDVNVAGSWVEVSCTVSGGHSTTIAGGPQSFTLDPDADFVTDENCTVTVFKDQVTDVDTDDPPDNMVADFVSSFSTPSTALPIDIVINEIHADPASDITGDANGDGTRNATDDEFVEIVNNSGSDVDLSGWTLSDAVGVRHTFPANSIIPNQCAIVVFGGGTPSGAFGGAIIQTASSGALGFNNSNDTVTLNDGSIDQASYAYGSETSDDQSITLDPDITGAAFVQHSVATGSGGALFSPGTMVDGSAFSGCPIPAPNVFINEVRIGLTGSPDADFFEIQGIDGTSLDGLTYVVLSGEFEPGSIDYAIDLTGSSIPADGFFVAGGEDTASAYGIIPDLSEGFDFFGSPSTHMIVSNFTGNGGDDLDTDNDGVLDIIPWTSVADSVAFIDGDSDTDYSYSSIVVGPDGNYTPAGTYRCDDAPAGTFDNNQLDFNTTNGTPGESNASLCSPAPSEVKIHEIQGIGSASPIVGDTVVIEGIVVGDFQAQNQFSGFHVQEEDLDADGDPATSEGIFVYHYSTDVIVGDFVQVTGTVAEYNGLTELTNVSDVTILSSGNPLPAATAVSLPLASSDALEAYEGMLVTFPQALTISEYFNYDRFGEIVLSTDRQFQPTAVYEPGSTDAANLAQSNALDRITLDDGRSDQNPDPARHPNGAEFDLTNTFRGGDTVQNMTGVMDYAFGAYKIQPTTGADYVSQNPRSETPDVGGSVKVASFNVLNYFTTLDTNPGSNNGPDICGPAEDLECRGANDIEEFTRQRSKIIAALLDINADVFGLIEIENHITDAAVQDLVSGLNDTVGAGTYAYVATGPIGTDAIKLALIYKPATVSLVGDYAILDSSVDSRFVDTKNRPVLAQSFVENETNSVFTVAVNHLKSKGSGCGDGDDDPEQGSCNLTRTLAAQALVDWLATDPTASGDADYLIIGDLNSYDKEDPIDAILAGSDDTVGTADDFTDLSNLYGGEYAYSYVFDSQLGYLDYALANASFLPQITGVATWHINADEPDLLDYDMTYKQDAQDALYEPNAYRSSDHDPVIIGLDFGLPRNADGCFVIAAENTPFEGRAATVETRHHVLNGMVWLLQSDLSRRACLEVHGTDGRDIVIGSRGDDDIFGYAGRDHLFGFFGDDVFTGGEGRDFFNGGRGQDTVLDYEWFEHCTSIEEGCYFKH